MSNRRRRAPGQRRPSPVPVVVVPHDPLIGGYAARTETCRAAIRAAVDFGLVQVDAVHDRLSDEALLALAKRLSPCNCGRLVLDDECISRAGLAKLAVGSITACRGVLLAAMDYAHATFGCDGHSALVHELAEAPPSLFEPVELGELLDRVLAAHVAGHGHAGHDSVTNAVVWPDTAHSSMVPLVH